ncbi:MAG: metal-dependent transcriptional regulator [Firmicutes bacterium]|nr:metal-dependent transcriptional regulator [Bacillota bacterium]
MAISPSLEDYLEAIYIVSDESGARTTDIAAHLGVSKASVNQAAGLLAERELIRQERYGPIYLTASGEEKARSIFHRHQLIKSFLTKVLKVDEATAEQDACNMEHVISKITVKKLAKFMEKKVN